MASYSSQEIAVLLSFIKSINDDRLSDALKTLTRFSSKNYQIQLKNLINRFCASHNAQKAIENLIKKNDQLQQKVKNLQLKIIQEKKRKANKLELEKQMAIKAKLTDCLLTDNLQKVLKEANQHEFQRLQVLVHDLMEYRWIKQSLPNPKIIQKYTQPTTNIDFTKETKHIKKIISDDKRFMIDLNQELARQLMNLFNHRVTQAKLSPHLFSKEVRQIFNRYNIYIKQLHEYFQQQLSQFRDIIIEACKRRSINAKYEQFDHTALLRLFILSLEPRQASTPTPIKGVNQQISVTSKQPLLQDSIKELVESINTSLQTSKQDFLAFTIKEHSLKAIWHCFCNIMTNFAFAKQSIQTHNEMLSVIANTETSAYQRLMKMNVQLKVRVPTSESITKSNFAEMVLKFESNLVHLLNLYDEKQKVLTSMEPKEEQKPKQVQVKHEDVGMSEDRIEIEQPPQNDLLAQQIETLKKQLEQAYTVIALEKKNNKKLRQKVKVSNSVQSSFFLSPQFTEDRTEAELQDEINALRIQIEKFKSALEEQKTLNSNFQQRFTQALRKAEATNTQELERQRKRYADLSQEMNYANEQIMQLNKLLQDNLFSSKRMTNSDSIIEKKGSIIVPELKVKSQAESKNFLSRVVQASVILERVEDVEDPVLLEKIQELQEIIDDLRKMMQTKENQYRQNRMNLESIYNRDIQELKGQNATLGNKIKDLQFKLIAEKPQNLKYTHLFPPGFIFDYADHDERLYLIENLVSYLGSIRRTRLLFRYDHFNKTNFHRYIDGHRNIVIIIKTIYGKLIAGYSEQAFVQGATKRGFGLILSLWARKAFQNKDQRAIAYDDYYVLFGNSELRLKSQELKVFSNLGIANGYYDNKGEKVHVILGEDKERQVDIAEYEIYTLDLQD